MPFPSKPSRTSRRAHRGPATPHLERFLPEDSTNEISEEEVRNPTTTAHLIRKIELLQKTVNKDQWGALDVLRKIAANQIAADKLQEENVQFYERLVHQVVAGERTRYTLAAKVNGVAGIPHMIAQAYGLPLRDAPTPIPAVQPKRAWSGFAR